MSIKKVLVLGTLFCIVSLKGFIKSFFIYYKFNNEQSS